MRFEKCDPQPLLRKWSSHHDAKPLQDDSPPVWAIFGDLMAGMVGVFVMLLIWTLSFQVDLAASLQTEVEKREEEQTRREQLEYALAAPLAEGRITLVDGRIGISGNILFALNSKELSNEGATLLSDLSAPAQKIVSMTTTNS